MNVIYMAMGFLMSTPIIIYIEGPWYVSASIGMICYCLARAGLKP